MWTLRHILDARLRPVAVLLVCGALVGAGWASLLSPRADASPQAAAPGSDAAGPVATASAPASKTVAGGDGVPFTRPLRTPRAGRSGSEHATRSNRTATLKRVTFSERSDGRGYVVRIEASARIPAYGTPRRVDDTHLEWTLYHTQAGPEADRTEPQGPVQAYAVEEQGAHVTLRLTLIEGRRVEAVAYRDRASSDLLLNLAYADARPSDRARALPQPAAEASGAEETETASEKTTADADASGSAASASEASASEASPKPTAAPETASAGSTDALASARERWRLNTIVIDAGHGGKDPGAQAYGVDEKDIVLDVALKLGEYIENRLGINVVYTRKTDKFIPLEERGRIANQAKAKLFISLHANASRSRSAHGTETFFLGRSKTEAARKVMKRENSVVRFEDNPEQYEAYDEKALVRYTLTQSTYMQNSEYLAGLIQEQFVERAGRDGRGVHQAGFYVLWSASMPAVLVELGFLTNRQENREMRTERVKDYLASAIFRAIRDYRPHYEKGISAPTAQGK